MGASGRDVPLALSNQAYGPGYRSATVTEGRYFVDQNHNLANLAGFLDGGQAYQANFLSFFDRTGGLERWGPPLSEVFGESPGVLTQYFERGVIDFKPALGLQRRLVWDYFGGGVEGSPDMGVEAGTSNTFPGLKLGPWGHKVSNYSVTGTWTGFLDAFVRMGGVESFGFPKTEAREDTEEQGAVSAPEGAGGVRQYFQAAILEYWPEKEPPILVLPLGARLRDRRYPGSGWLGSTAFRRTPFFSAGADYDVSLLDFSNPSQRTEGSNGTLVGRSLHAYAIALHPQRHLFYADGWYVVYYDGSYAVSAYSADGLAFGNHERISHQKVHSPVSVYYLDGIVYLLYADPQGLRIYLRVGTAAKGSLSLGEPIEVVEMGQRLMAHVPNLAIDPSGLPWVAFRGLEDLPDGSFRFYIRVVKALDPSLKNWSKPTLISLEETSSMKGGAGTSGSIAFVGDSLIAVYSPLDLRDPWLTIFSEPMITCLFRMVVLGTLFISVGRV